MANIWDKLEQEAFQPAKQDLIEGSIWDSLEAQALGLKDPNKNKPGFISDIKRGGGQAISALGSTLQDLGPKETGEAIQSYGEKIVRRNPSQISTVEEALSNPFTTVREAIGEVIPQVGISGAFGIGGRIAGGILGAPFGPAGIAVGQTIVGAGAAYAGNLIQEYGGIRADQREAGMNDVGRALMTGGAAAVLDTAFGAERLTNKVLGKGSSFLQREAGTSLTKNIAKQGAIGLAEEAGTETIQTGLERYGAFKELTGAEAYNEYGLSAIKGGIGGGVIRGGMAGIAGERRPENSLLGGSFENNTNNVTSNADAIKGAINVNAGPSLSTQEIVNQTVGVVNRQKKEQEAIVKQRQADMTAAMNEPTGRKIADPVTGVERDETAFDAMQRQAGPDSQQVAMANAQANQQKAQQQTEEEIAQQAASRKTILDKFGTTPVFNEQGAQIGVKFNGNMYFSGMTNKLNEAVDKILVEEAAKPELTHHVEFAWLDAFKNQNTDKTITPKSLAGKVEAYLAGATNIDDVLDRVKAEIKDLEGKKGKSTAAQLGFLENFRDNLIGEENGIQTEQQVPAGVGNVPVEGRAAETGTGDLGLLQSNGIRPIGTGSDNGVQNGQQDVGGGEAVPRDYAGGAIASTVPNGQETGQVNEQLPITNGESQAGRVEGAENADRASDEFFEQNRQQFERENNSPEGQRWRRETGLDYAYLSQDLKDKWTRAVSTGNVTSRLVKNILADFDEKPNYAVMLADRIIVKNNAMDANTEPKIKRLFAYLISTPLNEQLTPVELKTLYGVTENTVSNWRKRAAEIVDDEGNFKAGWSETTKKLLPEIITEIKQKYNIENDATLAKLLTLGNNDLSSDISDIESEIKQELGQYEVELNVKNKEGQEEETGVKESSRKSISVNEQYNLGESVGTKGVKLIQQIKELEAKIDAATANDDFETVDELTLKKEDLEADLAAAEVLAKKAQKLSKTQNLSKKGAENAFQEQSTDERNVRKPAEGGQAVGEGNAKPESTSREVVVKVEKKKQRAPKVEEKTTKETKSAAQLWDALGAPVKYDGLSPTGKADWALAVKDNKGNLITANKIFEEEQKVQTKTALVIVPSDEKPLGKEQIFNASAYGVSAVLITSDNGKTYAITGLKAEEPNKGSGSKFMKDLTNWADKNGITLELTAAADDYKVRTQNAPAQKDLVNWYAKNGFGEPKAGDRYQTRVRPPQQLADESRTIEGEARIVSVGEKEQVKLITDQTSSLTDAQNTRLEQHYGAKRGTEEFISKIKDDVLKYVTKGAEAVAGAVRDIIKQIANGVMSIAIVLNPNLASDPIKIIVPTYETRTEQVIQKAPSTVAKNMSPAAQRAYEVIYPTIKDELTKTNKLFIITDKPTATQFIFNPDGTLLFQSKVLVAKSFGDFMKGDNNIDANKITPAGLMKLVQRTNTSSTQGYDFDTVYGVEGVNENTGEKYFTTLMHSVWLSEKDAQQRQQALKEAGPQNSRYSFGCINVDKDTFGKVLKGHENQMNGATLFVVPDNQENVMEFVNGKAVLEKDIARQGITPKTKTVTEKVSTETVAGTKGTQLAAKEEKDNVQFSKIGKVKNPEKASNIDQELKAFIGNINLARLQVVQNIENLSKDIQDVIRAKQEIDGGVVQALVVGNKAYMIASNIEKGTARAVFMHEVGSHLGLEKLLSPKQYTALADTLASWVKKKDSSIESKLAYKAFVRTLESNEVGTTSTKEFVAYFIEEAVKAGIDPTALKYNSSINRWFATLWKSFKAAIRKLGLNPEKMTAQDVIDMAYGAARLEVHGAWHGTAADFSKFSHKFMSTGEGNQAFGWGTYLAQRRGIAYEYFKTDVSKKTKNSQIIYKGKNFQDIIDYDTGYIPISPFADALRNLENSAKEGETTSSGVLAKSIENIKRYISAFESQLKRHIAELKDWQDLEYQGIHERIQELIEEDRQKIASYKDQLKELNKFNVEDIEIVQAVKPIGNLMRVDYNAEVDELLDLDKTLSEQSDYVKRAFTQIREYIDLAEESFFGNIDNITGRSFYDWLALELQDNNTPAKWVEKDYGDIKKASELLDSIGIKGNIYLDATSRYKNAPATLQTRNVVIFNDSNVSRIASQPGARLEDIKFSFAAKQPISAIRAGAKSRIDALPPSYRGPVQAIFDTIQDAAKKGSIWASFTEDLALVAQKYIPSVTKYVGLMKERQAIKTKYERRVEEVLQDYEKLDKSVKGTGEGSVNKFLKDSTMGNKWGFQPSWIKEAVPIDKDIADRFNKMPDNAQKVIKKVFEHGFNTLSDMKQSVMSNITTEYDALIKEAEADEDAKEVSSLQKKKADALRDYRSLMSVQANSPYAPLKRFGNYVVAGKSQEYLNAEEAKDRKTIEKLQKDGDHYFVQFAETWAEAKAIARSQEGNYAFVEPFEKDDAERAMYGGKDVSDVFQRFRTMADDSLGDLNNKSKKTIDSLLLNLQLALLSDQSARQSENRRKGIAGAEDDMMRSFATQGRASAHFISTLHNTSAIYDQLRNMKKEADASTTGRGDRRRYYNEFMKRHAMAFNYESNPLLDKALGVTSMWMLLTNPAYYLQNLTQPYMMSMPVMAAKHGYAKTTSAMMQGYKDIASVIRSEGLNEKTYSKLPADVREAIETLVNSGRIDISLESDLGRWQSTEEKNPASIAIEKLRSISQDVESINRVVTAVAAYRLEKQDGASQADAIAYADKVIIDTHGDYSGFNAPRFTRQGVGRLMTQFRKFQLIQISLMAKLINQSFKGVGKNAEETKQIRLVGKKALIYTLSHTFAMAGVMGMPGFAAIAWIVGAAFGDEDEPDNPEATLRKIIGDNAVADVLLKGIPKLLGVDLSGKLGMGQMLSILPYTEIDLSRDGYAKALAASMGPFLGGLLPKTIDAAGLILQGNYYKGLAALAPTGLGNAVKAVELLDKGVVKRNGDVVLSADDISTLDAMSQALGLPTNKITDKQFIMSSEFKADKFYSERTTELKTEYTQAFRKGDTEELGDIRRQWEDTQLARVRNGLKRQPISELFRAPQEQLKRQKDIKGGIVKPSLASGFVTER